MQGLMQDWPLVVSSILTHASRWHGDREIVTRSVEGPIHRYTYRDLDERARRLASAASSRLGLKKGDVVGTMAWNTYRHLETWYALMGIGGVVHTLNPRLFPEQLQYIIAHAEDRLIFTDLTFVPLFEKLMPALKSVKGLVVMTDRAHMPASDTLKSLICYEDLIAEGDPSLEWPALEETAAAGMCYTSGTTGNPKGVVYSHRSNVLHAMSVAQPDVMSLSSRDSVLPVVPMFHANAWSLAFSVPMTGAKMVMPGARMDGPSIYELLDTEMVTMSAAVPTVWMMLLQHLEQTPGLSLPHLERVFIGGSACPEVLMRSFADKYGVEVQHGWGMTEMSPIGSVGSRKGTLADLPDEEWRRLKLKQGRPFYGVDMKITDDQGQVLPNDGATFGRLKVKGPAVARSYFKGEGAQNFDGEGWFDTGDVSTIDEHGYMQVTDRSKDVIKSGGEWISSIELENVATGCAGVAEAAAIGLPHLKWDERPLLVVVRKKDAAVSKEDVLKHLTDKVAKWWIPDDVVFVEEIPHTATGKISKLTLRSQFKDYRFPA